MPKRKTIDEKAAEKYAKRVTKMSKWAGYASQDYLAGLKYGRRTAIEAIKRKDILNDPHNAASKSEFWKGVLGGKTWAIDAIKKRGKR